MIEDLMPFILMFVGMVAVAAVFIFVTVRNALMGNKNDYYNPRFNNHEERRDAGDSAGRGSGFMGG
jgi:hypothetical protein